MTMIYECIALFNLLEEKDYYIDKTIKLSNNILLKPLY